MAKESRRRRSRERRRSRSDSRSPSPKRHKSPRKKSHKDKKSEKSKHRRSRSKDSKCKIAEKSFENEDENSKGIEDDLEKEMRRRRERVEEWRSNRKLLEPSTSSSSPKNNKPHKVINLDNDDDDDEEDDDEEDGDGKKKKKKEDKEREKKESDDEVDPLDAFMMDLDQEMKKVNNTKLSKAKESTKKKGELMENNVDALEYSSEPEQTDPLEDLASGNKKKELAQVDHRKVLYNDFKKNFYIEVPEIANMTIEEVTAYRKELDDITVTGSNVVKPIKTWAQCGLSRKVLDMLKKHNFIKPTPIQAQSLPIIMSGRDMIGIAKTGSGKTLAFVLPMLRHVSDQSALAQAEGPIAVILTPTRELAMQIGVECRKFCKNLNLRCLCIYGGRPISEQIAELKRGAEVVVCTPGRMIDMLSANSGRVTNLRRCTYVVLDEADRMFDMGFEQQVIKIVSNIRPDSQRVLFSATFPPKIENLARRILYKPVEVAVGAKSVVCADVVQHVMVIEDSQKFLKLLELLGIYQERGSVLVFVHKQEHADELMKNLMKQGYPCMSLHGGIDQFDRDSSMQDFKQGNIKLLIATSVCSRGLDVKDLILVLNYDCPNHYEDYVHRCGRTGRAGNQGFAYTFLSPDQGRYAGDIIKALKYSKALVPESLEKLWQDYKKEAEAEGKTVKSSSGFKGKGFRFDETEAQLAEDRRKMQKTALGLQDSDEEDAGVDIEEKIEQMFASKKWVSNVSNKQDQATQQKLQQALKAAEHINKQLLPPQEYIDQKTAAAIIKGGVAMTQVSSKTIAEQMADRINAKLGYRPVMEDKEAKNVEEVDHTRRFEEELEINDFPQTARWKVTSREALSQICEFSEAGITVRGTYFPPNKEPKEGEERKLYLAIEASSEIALGKAKSEVVRLIKEELVRLQNSYQPINRNRYKVV